MGMPVINIKYRIIIIIIELKLHDVENSIIFFYVVVQVVHDIAFEYNMSYPSKSRLFTAYYTTNTLSIMFQG